MAAGSALAAGNVVAWAMLHGQHPAALPAAFAVAALVGALATCVAWRSPQPTELRWDGAEWHCNGVAVRARVAFDLGPWLLLQLVPSRGSSRWLAVARRATTGPWTALRTALHARAAPLAR